MKWYEWAGTVFCACCFLVFVVWANVITWHMTRAEVWHQYWWWTLVAIPVYALGMWLSRKR